MATVINALVAFLGAPKQGYRTATYHWGDQYMATPYCSEALVSFLKPERLVVMVTSTAAQIHLVDLKQRVERHQCEVVPVTIPEEGSEEALWDMFNACVKNINAGESVAFDVTYGFRYIPMLMLLAGHFLNVTKGVKTVGIYYGAFEATDPDEGTPILSLQSLSKLMSWISAAAHFEQTGNAQPLFGLINEVDDRSFTGLNWGLRWTSQGIRLGLATQVGESVNYLLNTLSQMPPQKNGAEAPIRALLDDIAEKYSPLAVEGSFESHSIAHLKQQARLISWYVQNELALQALLLAREWLVSWVGIEQKEPHLFVQETRDRLATILNKATLDKRKQIVDPAAINKSEMFRKKLKNVAQIHLVLSAWTACIEIRNQLAHMSMVVPEQRISSIEDIMKRLRDLDKYVSQILATITAY